MPNGCGGKGDAVPEPPSAPPPPHDDTAPPAAPMPPPANPPGAQATDASLPPAPPPPDPPGTAAPAAAPAYGSPPSYPVPPRNSGRAIASLVLGICASAFALFFFWLYGFGSLVGVVCGILGIVFGRRARREIDASPGTVAGRGLATAGIVTGWIGLVAGVIGFIGIGLFIWWLVTTEEW